MKRKWTVQLLLSYLPAFLLVVVFIMMMTYLIVIDMTQSQTRRADEVFAGQVMQSVDYELRAIDNMVMREIGNNEKFLQYLRLSSSQDTTFLQYQVSRDLASLMQSVSGIDSVYLVRLADFKVISTNQVVTEPEQFADFSFVQEVLQGGHALFWHSPRAYREFPNEAGRQVISLVRGVPLLSGHYGLLVVNVNLHTLNSLLKEMAGARFSFIELVDTENKRITSSGAPVKQTSPTDMRASYHSAYSGWTLITGLKYGRFIDSLTQLSRILIVLIVGSVLLGVGWFWYAARRHYRPIKSLLQRIESESLFRKKETEEAAQGDEFQRIASSLTYLVDQFNHIEKQYSEETGYKKRHLFEELVKGNIEVNNEQDASLLGFRSLEGHYCCMVAEINRYAQFLGKYNAKDQELVKYVIRKVFDELAEQHGLLIWSEWMESYQLGIIVDSKVYAGADSQHGAYRMMCEQAADWIEMNLDCSVRIGLGNEAPHINRIAQSCDEALETLDHKTIFGDRPVMAYHEIESRPRIGMYAHIERIVRFIDTYKTGDDAWKEKLAVVFAGFRDDFLSDTDILRLCGYLVVQMDREMTGLSRDARAYWSNHLMPELNRLLGSVVEVGEMEQRLTERLRMAATEIMHLRSNSRNHGIMKEIKQYIEQSYDDQQLSLQYVSDHFSMNPTHLSRLFKEEFGERFIDYLTGLRMQEAKRLLATTAAAVHEIADQVGYNHSFSFIRAFKKSEGMTPGDYRRIRQENEDRD